MGLSKTNFEYVCEIARKNSAIVIGREKEYLVENRLGPLASKAGFSSLEDFIDAMRKDPTFGALHAKAIDALTTNETYFFRDFHPFESLRNSILPEIISKRSKERRLSVWCAACSTGQEPYSLAMVIKEHFPELGNWDVSIMATDLSTRVLEQAVEGSYNQIEVNRGLPAHLLSKYFSKQGERWLINDSLKDIITFKRMNLIEAWPFFECFDIVMMRNVLIYFDVDTKRSILGTIRTRLQPHGRLFLGTSETTINLDDQWEPDEQGRSVCFQLATSN